MQSHIRLFTAAALAVGGLTTTAWAQNQTNQNQDMPEPSGALLERARETDTSAAELRQDDPASHASGMDATGQAHLQANPQSQQAQRLVGDTVSAVLSAEDLSDLSNQFTQDDRERLGTFQTDPLRPVAADLKAEFEARYDQDLTFENEQTALFEPGFIHLNGQDFAEGLTEEQAQPAGAEINADDRDVQSDDGADVIHRAGDAPGAGQRSAANVHLQGRAEETETAQTAGAQTAKDPHMLVIQKQGNLPAVHLPLSAEQGALKIDVPDDVDAELLTDRLTNQLRQAHAAQDQWPDDPTQARQLIAHHVLLALSGDQSPTHQPAQTNQPQGGMNQ